MKWKSWIKKTVESLKEQLTNALILFLSRKFGEDIDTTLMSVGKYKATASSWLA